MQKPAKVQRKTDKSVAVANLLESAKGFLKNGATPDVVEFSDSTLESINEEVIGMIQHASETDRADIYRQHADFGLILESLRDGNSEVRILRNEERQFSVEHKACRNTEHDRCEAKRTCENHMWNLWKEWEACEIGLREIHDQIDGHFCPPGTNGTLHSFRVASVPLMDEYIEWKLDCDRKETAYDNVLCDNNGHDFVHVTSLQIEEPVSIHNLLDTRSSLCNALQTNLEEKSCGLAIKIDEVGRDLHQDFTDRLATFAESTARIGLQQKDRHQEYCTLVTVECLLNRVHDLNGRPCDSENGVDDEVALCEAEQINCDPCRKNHHDSSQTCAWKVGVRGISPTGVIGAFTVTSGEDCSGLNIGGDEYQSTCASVTEAGVECTSANSDWDVLNGDICIQTPPPPPLPYHCDNCDPDWTDLVCIPVACEIPCLAGFVNQEYAGLPAVPQAIFTELNPGCNQYPECSVCAACVESGCIGAVPTPPVVVPVAPLWSQHMEDSAKCNNNVDVQYVNSQAECQQIAVAAGHPYYSFRHNEESSGHKCMSSATCVDIVTDTSNEWNMYMAGPSATGSSEFIGCFRDTGARDLGTMQGGGGGPYNSFPLCHAHCNSLGKAFMSLQYGGECFCADSYGAQSGSTVFPQIAEGECSATNEPCHSNSYNCGGTWAQAIYSVVY